MCEGDHATSLAQAAPSSMRMQQAPRQPKCRVDLARLVLAALLVPLVAALHRHGHPASLGERPVPGGAQAAATAPKAAASKARHVSAAATEEESGRGLPMSCSPAL